MADYRKVTSYRVFHYYTGPQAGTTSIVLALDPIYTGGYRYERLAPDRAHHIVDLLRNEKPVFLETESGLLQVAYEPVGEGDHT